MDAPIDVPIDVAVAVAAVLHIAAAVDGRGPRS
jgi:hypothetical protein